MKLKVISSAMLSALMVAAVPAMADPDDQVDSDTDRAAQAADRANEAADRAEDSADLNAAEMDDHHHKGKHAKIKKKVEQKKDEKVDVDVDKH